jgi:hypothetical protein
MDRSVHSDTGLDHLSGIEDPVESDALMALSYGTASLTRGEGQQVPECREEAGPFFDAQ